MSICTGVRRLADLTAETKEALAQFERDDLADLPLDTTAAAMVARAFGAALNKLSTEDIRAMGELTEELMTTGDEMTQTVIATGFLESLLGQASGGLLDFRKIVWAIGPESRKYCRAWDEFTGVKTDGLW